MNTPFADFYESIRHILGDRDANFRMYPDDALLAGLRSLTRMGKFPNLALGPDLISLTPAVAEPNTFALIVYHFVKSVVVANPDTYSYATRAIKESFGGWKTLIWEVESNLQSLENGEYLRGWQSYYTWIEGLSGLPLSVPMTRVRPGGPSVTVSIQN